MGLLVEGKALSPEDIKPQLKYIRDHGITQFLNTWNRLLTMRLIILLI